MVALTAALLVGPAALSSDWPQFRGPGRDGTSPETGLMKSWPAGGPKLLWTAKADLGKGFSSVSIAGGSVYTTGLLGDQENLFAFGLDGRLKWKTAYGKAWKKSFPSARTTPTADGDRVYVMSSLGRIACFSARDGRIVWSVDTEKEFGGRNIRWGIAESPLVVDGKVICTPGGPDATMVALDKKTGRTVWTTRGLSDLSAYCAPIHIADGRRDLVVTMTDKNIVGVATADGSVLWKHPYSGKCQAHAVSPVYHDGQLLATSGYDEGAVMLGLSSDGRSARLLWKEEKFDTHHGGVVVVDGHVYGTSWKGNRDGKWMCLDWKTGRVRFETEWICKGSIIHADGMFYCYEEKEGTIGLVRPDPTGFRVTRSFKVTQGSDKHWAHPAIAGGRLYVRHGDKLMCYDISDGRGAVEAQERSAPELSVDLGNGVTMGLIHVAPGTFSMGDDTRSWEKPAHQVTITRGFYLGKYEVTQAQYEAVVGRNPSNWKAPDRPVEHVAWGEAVEFCRLATERTGRRFRLPTEAEWEYACRAGSTGMWCFGNSEVGLSDYGWYSRNAGRQTHPVGRKKPNAWGLHDMHGNVSEWVADWFAEDYYRISPREDPTGPTAGQFRVRRGGSWFYAGHCCEATYRLRSFPRTATRQTGFRVAASIAGA
jgi:formylglycine-generating enzyme required for sulfatase activity